MDNQSIQQTFTFSNFVNYTYDGIGQLITATGKESGGTSNRLLEQFGYVYDAAQNLNYRTNNALVEYFGVNNLNELSSATNGGTLTVEGTTGAAATGVTVNGSAATLYSDQTFAEAGFTVTNGTNVFTAIAGDSLGRHSTNSVSAYLPATNSFTYDLNGNLLYDGLRTFAYDDENQLASVLVSNAWQSQFIYDGKMRRRIRKEFTWQGGAWVQTNEVHYIYDGTVVFQERDINNLPVTTYTRGKDLSGSLQGAGGIGGMLAMSQPSTVNPQHYYYHADGNGNITAMINGQQIVVAKYLYDPFGNTLAASGPMARANVYRFSSKEFDQNSGLTYYLYRFYDPNLQRWLNRDPIQEAGGIDLYVFTRNSAVNTMDPRGLFNVFTPGTLLVTVSAPPAYPLATIAAVGAGAAGGVALVAGGAWLMVRVGETPPSPVLYPNDVPPGNPIPVSVQSTLPVVNSDSDEPSMQPEKPAMSDKEWQDLQECAGKAVDEYTTAFIKKCGRRPTPDDLDDFVNACMKAKGHGDNFLEGLNNR